MTEIWRSNLLARSMKRLKIYTNVRRVDMDQLPQNLSYYLIADIWTQSLEENEDQMPNRQLRLK